MSPDPALEEWKVCRQVISDSDARVASLRQYGLSIVVSLLTIQGLIFTLPTSAPYVPRAVQFGVIVATLLLICALFVTERTLRVVQRAAALRARVLERRLDMELTQSISTFYQVYRSVDFIALLYYFLIGAAGVLGLFVLNPVTVSLDALTYLLVVAVILSWVFVTAVRLRSSDSVIDWALDRYRVARGDVVGVTLTNLTGQAVGFPVGAPVWRFLGIDGSTPHAQAWRPADQPILPGESRTWWRSTRSFTAPEYFLEFAAPVAINKASSRAAGSVPAVPSPWTRLPRSLLVDESGRAESPSPGAGSGVTEGSASLQQV